MDKTKRRKLHQLAAGVGMLVGSCGVAFGFFMMLVSASKQEEQIGGWIIAGSLLPLLAGMALAGSVWINSSER